MNFSNIEMSRELKQFTSKKGISRLKHEEIKIYIYEPIKNEGIESIMQNISTKRKVRANSVSPVIWIMLKKN